MSGEIVEVSMALPWVLPPISLSEILTEWSYVFYISCCQQNTLTALCKMTFYREVKTLSLWTWMWLELSKLRFQKHAAKTNALVSQLPISKYVNIALKRINSKPTITSTQIQPCFLCAQITQPDTNTTQITALSKLHKHDLFSRLITPQSTCIRHLYSTSWDKNQLWETFAQYQSTIHKASQREGLKLQPSRSFCMF